MLNISKATEINVDEEVNLLRAYCMREARLDYPKVCGHIKPVGYDESVSKLALLMYVELSFPIVEHIYKSASYVPFAWVQKLAELTKKQIFQLDDMPEVYILVPKTTSQFDVDPQNNYVLWFSGEMVLNRIQFSVFDIFDFASKVEE